MNVLCTWEEPRMSDSSPATSGRGGNSQLGDLGVEVRFCVVESNLGRLMIAATPDGICSVKIGDSDAVLEAELAAEFPSATIRRDVDALADWADAFRRYAAGEQMCLNLPLDIRATAFRRRVWNTLRAIPYGTTRSYQDIARAVGEPRAVRAVAQACANNPVALIVPCHRVVRSDGELGGYRWGEARKRVLLEQERTALLAAEQRLLREFLREVRVVTPEHRSAGTYSGAIDSRASPRLTPGHVIGERYEVRRLLGVGGAGVVYEVYDRELDEVVALKMLWDQTAAADPDAVARFKREIRLARRVSHPNIVRTHDIGETNGCRFITMEYVEGLSLAHLLERIGALPVSVALGVGKQLCRALQAIHACGMMHRDIKPQNVLLTRFGEVKLADFGIAVLLEQGADPNRHEAASGTLAYMAPEHLLGEPLDARVDLYAVGVLLHECLTGHLPFTARSVEGLIAQVLRETPRTQAEVDGRIPPALGSLIQRAIAADRDDRPRTAAALHDALAELRDETWSERPEISPGVGYADDLARVFA